MDPLAMAPKSSGSGAGSGSLPQLPEWVAWLQVGLSALLAVLFLVMLSKARHQGARIQELQDRIQGLENTRALERTRLGGAAAHHRGAAAGGGAGLRPD
jgi:membrane protein implicated in regulation of membrane protease activity